MEMMALVNCLGIEYYLNMENTMQQFGIDISRWQKGLSLEKAKCENDVRFVIIKAGGHEGSYYKDSQFDNFYVQALKNKIPYGFYYFGRAFSVQEAQQEANHFIQLLQDKIVYRVFYDVEANMLNQGRQHLTDIIKAFCDVVNSAGYNCGIYMSASPFRTQVYDDQLSAYSHWVASYGKGIPTIQNPVTIWQFGGEINCIRSNKIAGMTVDQNYLYQEDYFVNFDSVSIPETTEKKSVQEIVQEVLDGKWGNYPVRKANLESAGYNYSEIQSAVENEIKRKASEKSKKSIDQLANEVLAGLWGTATSIPSRKMCLLVAGYDYSKVQQRVNEIIEQRKQENKTYVVVKGDTLTKIAKQYNTTVEKLAIKNGITDPNKISIGQVLVIA